MSKACCGYHTKTGYMGQLPDKKWMLFASDHEYMEYISEEGSENDARKEDDSF